MPPTPPKDAIIIALDVGKSVSQLFHGEEKSFFQQARDCASWIIQRKLISQSKDSLCLLLIGSEDSNKKMAISGYKNISCKFDFQLASWDMLKFIESEVQTTDKDSDWVGALIVSMEMLKVFEEFNNVENKKIVFFSDFTHPASDNLDVIINSIQALNIEITIIGPDHISVMADEDEEDEEDDEPSCKKMRTEANKSEGRQEGEKLVSQLWRKLPENIGICTFESALKQLCSYTRKSVRVTPWNCILDIGEVKIKISMLKKTDPKSAKTFTTKCVKPPESESGPSTSSQSSSQIETVETVRDKVMHYAHQTGDGSEIFNVEVKPEDTVEGFRYGTTVVPFTEEDKQILGYKTGPKAFSVIGFTAIASVPYYLLTGDCSYVVVARDKDKNAEIALSAVIQAMKKTECLAIVRRVYSDNRGLSLGILYPVIEEILSDETDEISHKEYLLFVELAFEEDVKNVDFPSLERVASGITDSQFDAIDNLIDGMSLMKADKGLRGEPCEAFDLPRLHDFKEQFFQYCVIQRGLYPEKPLPTSLPVHIKAFVKLPKSVEEKSESVVEDLKKQFKIESTKDTSDAIVDVHEKPGSEQETESLKIQHFDKFVINEEKNLIKKSWMKLFSDGFPLDSDFQMFLLKYAKLEKMDEPEFLKTFKEVLGEVRRKYLNGNPDSFNKWMRSFKEYEEDEVASKMWEVIVSEKLGLISEKESKNSKVNEDEAREFYGNKFSTSEINFTSSSEHSDVAEELLIVWTDSQKEQMAVDSFY